SIHNTTDAPVCTNFPATTISSPRRLSIFPGRGTVPQPLASRTTMQPRSDAGTIRQYALRQGRGRRIVEVTPHMCLSASTGQDCVAGDLLLLRKSCDFAQ